MPWIIGFASVSIASFDSWLKFRDSEGQKKALTSQTIIMAAAIAAAMFFAVKAARR